MTNENEHDDAAITQADELYALLNELKLNMTVKRHSSGGYDARIYHPWLQNPILSACGKSSYQECIDTFCQRLHAIENMRVGLQRKNEKREKLHASQAGRATWDAEENYSQWNEWI